MFNPVFLVALTVCFHMVLGVPNYFFYSSDLDSRLALIPILFIGGLYCGQWYSSLGRKKPADSGYDYRNLSSNMWSVYFLSTAILVMYVLLRMAAGGEGGFWGRFARNPVMISLSYLGIPSLLFLFHLRLSATPSIWNCKKVMGCSALYVFFVSWLGYRTPVVVLALGMFLIYIYQRFSISKKKLKLNQVVLFLTFGFVVMVGVSYVAIARIEQEYDIVSYYWQINWTLVSSGWDWIVPIAATIRADYLHLDRAMLVGNTQAWGTLFLSDLITWLPGEQLASRSIIGDLVGARLMPNGLPMSITASLPGVLYLDFGYIGVFLSGAFVAWVLLYLYSRQGSAIWALPLLCFILANFIKSIHSGYLDFSFYIQLGVVIIVLMLSKTKLPNYQTSRTTIRQASSERTQQ